MRIVLTNDRLKQLTLACNKVIPRNGSLPMLHYLLIRQNSGSDATVTATNLDETLQYVLPGAVQPDDGPDAFLIAFDALKKMNLKKGDAVTLQPSTDNDLPTVKIVANIGGKTVHSEIASMPVSGYPATLKTMPVKSYPVGQLLAAYRKAITFASTDETRFVLNSVFHHTEEHALIGMDGRRLSMFVIPDLPKDADFILPPSKLLRNGVLSTETGAIGFLQEDDRQIVEIQTGPWRYQVKCIEGQYPNYKQVIPDAGANFAGSFTFAEKDIPLVQTAVDQFAIPHNSQIHIYGDADRVVILSAQPGGNDPSAYVALPNSLYECPTEEPIVQSINGEFLLEGLRAGFNACQVPADISPWRCTGKTAGLHVVMPLHMDDREKRVVVKFVNQHLIPTPKGKSTVKTPETTEIKTNGNKQQTDTGNNTQHKPDLTLVTTDPVQELIDAVTAAQEAVKQANTALNGIKGKMKAVEKHYRARQKEFDSTRKIIENLKEAANF